MNLYVDPRWPTSGSTPGLLRTDSGADGDKSFLSAGPLLLLLHSPSSSEAGRLNVSVVSVEKRE